MAQKKKKITRNAQTSITLTGAEITAIRNALWEQWWQFKRKLQQKESQEVMDLDRKLFDHLIIIKEKGD